MRVCRKCSKSENESEFGTSKAWCKACCRRYRKERYKNVTRDKELLQAKKRYRDPEQRKKQREYRAQYLQKETTKKRRAYKQKLWSKSNKAYQTYMQAFKNIKNSKRPQAVPKWLTTNQKNELLEHYQLAKDIQWLSEEPLWVDHIIPLNGEIVCGLHVPWNLQILPKSLNIKKHNKI